MSGDGVPAVAPIAELAREGDYWTLSFEERVMRVRDSKGMRYLAELLAHPEREIEVLALATSKPTGRASPAETAEAGLSYSDLDAGPLLDEQARRAYRERLQELRGELEQAEAFHDPERAARARAECEAIADELASTTGLGGRDRRAGTPAERARLNVSRAIRSTIARISEHDQALGEHLTACVRTGRVCVYRPDRAAPIAWSVSTRPGRRRPLARLQAPETRYARKGEISIAYQVLGDGPLDVILVNGLVANMDLWWADPAGAATLRKLASFSRLIMFDKPGTGLSDPVAGAPSLEQRVEDIRAVMDAVDCQRAALIGYSEGGLASAVFAATYPQRTEALILVNTTPRTRRVEGQELDSFDHAFDHFWSVLDEIAAKRWGEGKFLLATAPSWARSEIRRRTVGIAERASASPGMVRAMIAALREYDLRAILPTISTPTLVVHNRDERFVPIDGGRDFAARIRGARLVELPGGDHIFFAGAWKPVVSEIETFLTSELHAPETTSVLQTVLFTSISGPSDDLPDEDQFRRERGLVQSEIALFGGRPLDTAANGFLASFDGPSRAVRCALALSEQLQNTGRGPKTAVHSGECQTVGAQLRGLPIQVVTQMADIAEPSEVLVSSTVCDLVAGSGIAFTDRGAHPLEGTPRAIRLYAVATDEPKDARPVSSVDGHVAQLTPGPRDTMTPVDRAAVSVAKHAPAISRLGFRLLRATNRRQQPDRTDNSPPR